MARTNFEYFHRRRVMVTTRLFVNDRTYNGAFNIMNIDPFPEFGSAVLADIDPAPGTAMEQTFGMLRQHHDNNTLVGMAFEVAGTQLTVITPGEPTARILSVSDITPYQLPAILYGLEHVNVINALQLAQAAEYGNGGIVGHVGNGNVGNIAHGNENADNVGNDHENIDNDGNVENPGDDDGNATPSTDSVDGSVSGGTPSVESIDSIDIESIDSDDSANDTEGSANTVV
ncbi:hypothetical protein BGX31_009832 [Mortierella sp. GBA43]|nr:hypothetical protein BGX31_009832 [Mortierella sp. GBA43]